VSLAASRSPITNHELACLSPRDFAYVPPGPAENGIHARSLAWCLRRVNRTESHSWSTTLMNNCNQPFEGSPLPLLAAADLQDHLMTATNDLDRLQTLLAQSCDTLMQSFHGAYEQVRKLSEEPPLAAATHSAYQDRIQQLGMQLGGAVTALQFQDMASQLINHTHQRLRSCADQIARVAMGDDEDGEAVVSEAPLRPNPVTQDEMDAGSITLF
jgi:hypothetical protein